MQFLNNWKKAEGTIIKFIVGVCLSLGFNKAFGGELLIYSNEIDSCVEKPFASSLEEDILQTPRKRARIENIAPRKSPGIAKKSSAEGKIANFIPYMPPEMWLNFACCASNDVQVCLRETSRDMKEWVRIAFKAYNPMIYLKENKDISDLLIFFNNTSIVDTKREIPLTVSANIIKNVPQCLKLIDLVEKYKIFLYLDMKEFSFHYRSFPPELEKLLQNLLSRVKKLCLKNPSAGLSGVKKIFKNISTWSSLEVLEVENLTSYKEWSQDLLRIIPSLKIFRIKNMGGEKSLIKGLLAQGKILEIEEFCISMEEENCGQEFIKLNTPNLRSLTLYTVTLENFKAIISHPFNSLRKLHIGFNALSDQEIRSLLSIIPSSGASLKELIIDYFAEDSSGILSDTIKEVRRKMPQVNIVLNLTQPQKKNSRKKSLQFA